MKYTVEEYLACGFYEYCGEVDYQASVVKAKKPFNCVFCGSAVKVGEHYFKETCIFEGEGRRAAKTCLPCLDRWIDETR